MLDSPIANPSARATLEIAEIARGEGRPRGLPNEWYVSEACLAFEREAIFGRNWFAVGFGKDVANPGDLYPVEPMGMPLLITRDRQGTIRVFHNVCSHRGMKLVTEPDTTNGLIRCPYHSWCYGLDGRLARAPMVGGPQADEHPDFDRSAHGLREVRSAQLWDTIFITLSDEAPAFEDYAASLHERWRNFIGRPVYHGGLDSSFDLTVRANWKLAVENYLEAYHLPWVHPGLNAYSRLEDHYFLPSDGVIAGQGSEVYRPILSPDGRAFPAAAEYPEDWTDRAEYPALYPNALFGLHKDHLFTMILEPRGPDVTIERTEIYYFDPDSVGDGLADLRSVNARQWRSIFEEDIGPVEGMQAGRRSPGFEGGVLTPVLDQPTRAFHIWLARQIAAA